MLLIVSHKTAVVKEYRQTI